MHNIIQTIVWLTLAFTASFADASQDAPGGASTPPDGTPAAAETSRTAEASGAASSDEADGKPAFQAVPVDAEKRLAETLAELSKLRSRVADETIPLSRTLNGLQRDYAGLQDRYRDVVRLRDARALDLATLTRDIAALEENTAYLANLLDTYLTKWEARIPISELQRYRPVIEAARLASEDETRSAGDVYRVQAEAVETSIDRIDDAIGGTRFEGTALNLDGEVRSGTFLLLGPAEFFRDANDGASGPVEQQLGSLEPTVFRFGDPQDATLADAVISSGKGTLPFDPTLGNARLIEETNETVVETVRKGGPVVVPILALAGASLLVALLKWIGLSLVPRAGRKRLEAVFAAIREHREEAAVEAARAIRGPTGRMLLAGVEHMKQPKDLIEEVMYEKILTTRLRVERFLPFIAITAAAAPLLGLLGTVTGIISTFKLITLFGTGDVKTLSSGISEALITTALGLVAAIPALLLHAFLSRKAKGIIDRMEQAAIALVNQISVAYPDARPTAPPPTPEEPGDRRQAAEALATLLAPVLDRHRGGDADPPQEREPEADGDGGRDPDPPPETPTPTPAPT